MFVQVMSARTRGDSRRETPAPIPQYQRPYRVALLDYRLPCMTGIELFQHMREVPGNVHGILVTGCASPETTEAALSAGLRSVVSKPVNLPGLMLVVEEACN